MRKHLKCWIWKILWVVSVVSLALAWYSILSKGLVLGLDPLALFWNALIFGVLSIPIKLDCHSCEVCMPTSSTQ